MVKIEPLTKETLKEAINLLNQIFLDEDGEAPGDELPASPYPKKYKNFLSRTKMSEIKYWVAVDDAGKVVGTIGLYCYEKDKDEAFWLGWFCVHSDLRRNGIGTKLLQFAIKKARKNNKRFLRLYTSPELTQARRLYEKYSFQLTGEGFYPDGSRKLYYELKLINK